MRAVPLDVLRAQAREDFRRRFSDVVPTKVRNAVALAALGEHRPLRFRGHYYRVPPLPFRAGVRLLVASQVLRDGQAPPQARERAFRTVRHVAGECVTTRRWRLWPLGRAWLPPRRNPFRTAQPEEVAALLAFLLDVPDDSPINLPDSDEPVDMIDGLMEYLAGGYPTTPDGLPTSWALYQYALRHRGRFVARELRRASEASRVAFGADEKTWKQWLRDLRRVGA